MSHVDDRFREADRPGFFAERVGLRKHTADVREVFVLVPLPYLVHDQSRDQILRRTSEERTICARRFSHKRLPNACAVVRKIIMRPVDRAQRVIAMTLKGRQAIRKHVKRIDDQYTPKLGPSAQGNCESFGFRVDYKDRLRKLRKVRNDQPRALARTVWADRNRVDGAGIADLFTNPAPVYEPAEIDSLFARYSLPQKHQLSPNIPERRNA